MSLAGRIDPFLQILANMKTAPEIVYYDFACKSTHYSIYYIIHPPDIHPLILPGSMDEYFNNREPQFWENTCCFCDM